MELIDAIRIFSLAFCASSFLTAASGQHMWPDYAKVSKKTTANSFVHMASIPFTYYESITKKLEVNYNGFVTFGVTSFTNVPPTPTHWPSSPKYMAVYWADCKLDLTNMIPSLYIYHNSERLYNVTRHNSLIKYVKSAVADPQFEPLEIHAVTWDNFKPKMSEQYPNDTATFQLLLATDSQVTYAIRGYHSLWQSPALASQTYYATAYSLGSGARPNITAPRSHTGPEVIRLGTKKASKDPFTCVQKTQAAVAFQSRSLHLLPPCPCYQPQAAKDQQFKTSSAGPRCYQSKNAPAGSGLLQHCCYNQYGLLIKSGKEAKVPVSTVASERRLQDAYDKCCADGSGLCEWFYMEIYQPNCANYTPAINASELPRFVNRDEEFVYDSRAPGPAITTGLAASSKYQLTSSVFTVFTSMHGFRSDRTGFSWNIDMGLKELRKVSYPQQLVFYVTDTNNISASYAPLFTLCLCEHTDQCITYGYYTADTRDKLNMKTFFGSDNYQSGNVNSMFCDCKGMGTGKFCEKPINVCDDCLVQQASMCDANSQNYCPSCPLGYQKTGGQCQVAGGHNIIRAGVCLISVLTAISSFLPWLQNSLTSHQ